MNKKKDIYERLTEQAVAGLQEKGLKWFRPWTNAQGDVELPINNMTKSVYKGINVWILTAAMLDGGYEHNEWLTYKQATERKGQVRKGEKSTEVVFWCVGYYIDGKWYGSREAAIKAGKKPTERDKTFSVRSYRVFNIAQCDAIEPRRKSLKTAENAEQVVAPQPSEVYANWIGKPELKHGGSSAYYRPSTDTIQMPHAEQFQSADAYHHTLYHEMVHATGHETRLKRKGVADPSHFGSETYAQEELVAEMGAQFLSALTGIDANMDNSQAYINGWCEKLQSEPRWVVYGSTQAQKAVNHILRTEN